MSPEQLDNAVDDLLDQLLDLPVEEQQAILTRLRTDQPEVCAHAEAVLTRRSTGHFDDLFPLTPICVKFTPSVAEPSRANAKPSIPGYEILGELGRGGMGVVYKARHLKLNRVVALKMILAGGHAGPADLERFRTEGEAVARLQHPNIVQIFEVGEHDGQSFFSIEFCSGGALNQKLIGTPLPPAEAAALVEKLARAMAQAHAQKIIHRDLKPANILLDTAGEPKITDFGLAKKLDDAGQTQTGAIMGTPSYMAPEQAGGKTKELGPPADIYALGAILYELLTSRPPFFAATPWETVRQVIDIEPISPRDLNPSIARDLETICLKCLHKEASKRYPSMLELAEDLRHFLANEPIIARPVSTWEQTAKWARRRPAMAGLLGVSAVAFMVLVAGIISTSTALVRAWAAEADANTKTELAETRRGEADTQTTRALDAVVARDLALKKAQVSETQANDSATQFRTQRDLANRREREAKRQLANSLLLLTQVDMAAKQEFFNYYVQKDTNIALERLTSISDDFRFWEWHYLRQILDGGLFTLYGHREDVAAVAYSADGRFILSGDVVGELRGWDARSGSALWNVRCKNSIQSIAINPNGRVVAVGTSGNEIEIRNLKDGKLDSSIPFPAFSVRYLAYAPEGRRLLAKGVGGSLIVLDSHEKKTLQSFSKLPAKLMSAVWTPEGTGVISLHERTSMLVSDVATGTKVLEFKNAADAGILHVMACSPDGSRVVVGDGVFGVKIWLARTGAFVGTMRGPLSTPTDIAFSPDGAKVAVSYADGIVKIWNAWSGTPLPDLKGPNGSIRSICFSPDSRFLVAGGWGGMVKVWDLTNASPSFPLPGSGIPHDLQYSPDSRLLATGTREGAIVVWDVSSGSPAWEFKLDNKSVERLRFGMDGKRLCVHGAPQMKLKVDPELEFLNKSRGIDKSPATIFVFDADSGTVAFRLPQDLGPISTFAIDPKGRVMVVAEQEPANGDKRCKLKIWNVEQGKLTKVLSCSRMHVTSLAVHPTRDWLACGKADGQILVWDFAADKQIGEIQGHSSRVHVLEYSQNGDLLASAGWDKVVAVWDGTSLASVSHLRGLDLGPGGIGFSPDGERVITWAQAGSVQLWDSRTGQPLIQLESPDGNQGISAAAYSPDGTHLAASTLSFDRRGTVIIWPAHPIKATRVFHADFNVGFIGGGVSFSPDGRLLAAWYSPFDNKGSAWIIWEVATGDRVLRREFPTGGIRSLEFSRDSSIVRITQNEGASHLFEVKTGNAVADSGGVWAKTTRTTPDGTGYAIVQNRSVRVVRDVIPSHQIERKLATAPQLRWHEQQMHTWEKLAFRYSAWAHLEAIAGLIPGKRSELIKKRAALLTPGFLAAPVHPYGWTLIGRAEIYNDDPTRLASLKQALIHVEKIPSASRRALDIRTLGGLYLRSGKPEEALAFLHEAASVRDVGAEPPVADFLLAIAYHQLGKMASGVPHYRKAVSWLDVYAHKQGVNRSRETYDPRFRPADWESWHEAEIFRIEADKLYAK